MTLVEELRRRAAEARSVADSSEIGLRYHAQADTWQKAADLVEADPLYKASPVVIELLTRIARGGNDTPERARETLHWFTARTEDLLATLPKEG
jgi:hypothetical protein